MGARLHLHQALRAEAVNTQAEPGAELPIRQLRDAMGPWVESCDLHYVTGGPRPGHTVELEVAVVSTTVTSFVLPVA